MRFNMAMVPRSKWMPISPHDLSYLPDFLKAIEHADLVIGSRYIPGGRTPTGRLPAA
jgi:hypothetical protein